MFFELLKRFGIHCDVAYYNEHISGKANHQLHQQLVPHLSKEEGARLFIEKENRFRQLAAQHLSPLPGFIDFLRAVRARGIRLAAVSNAPRPNVMMMLGRFGLASEASPIGPDGDEEGLVGHLDTVVLGDECEASKPSPVPYQLAMQRLCVEPDECIVFEDSASGVTAGVRAGCQVVGVMTSKSEEEMKKLGCYACIHDYTQIDIDKMITTMTDYITPKL